MARIHCSRMWNKSPADLPRFAARHLSPPFNPETASGECERQKSAGARARAAVQRTMPNPRIPCKSRGHAREILSVDTNTPAIS